MPYKEYGGYIEYERYYGTEFHPNALALNCGRNCLAYLIQTKGIKKIYLPFFLCSSVADTCEKYGVEIQYYHVNKNFQPEIEFEFQENEYLYMVNYYGQLENGLIKNWKEKCPNLIVDNAQAYFQMPVEGVDTLYTCRKYFGVADGAYLYTDQRDSAILGQDYSYERMRFLMGRYEKNANEFYGEYVENNKRFQEAPILRMSGLTHNLLKGIDYAKVTRCRTENFGVLNEILEKYNDLVLNIPQGAFMYPLYIENGEEVRNKCRLRKIYIPTLWPDVLEKCDETTLEYHMAKNILPLPVDQRYGKEDMEYIAEVIKECIN